MNALFIYCAGGFGKEVIDIARRINHKKKSWKVIIFIDDFCLTETHYGARVFRFDKACDWISYNSSEVLIANGEPAHRSEIRTKLDNHGIKLANCLIDDSAIISNSANINNGVLISPYCSVSSNAILDENCSINTMSIVGHDVNIGENVVISSMVNLGGNVRIGRNSYVGMGALIKEKVNIGNNVIALGNPARAIRKNEDGKVFGL